jgi:hypothetical protein
MEKEFRSCWLGVKLITDKQAGAIENENDDEDVDEEDCFKP